MLLRMLYIRGEMSVVGPEQMKDLLMNDPIYGMVWSLFIRAIVTQMKRLPLLFSVGKWKTKWFGLYDWDCSLMMLFLRCKADHYRVIFWWCAGTPSPSPATETIVEHKGSCFHTLVHFWLWNHFYSWTIPGLCHMKFSTVLHNFQLSHEHNILVIHSLWIHRILFCSCSSLFLCFPSASLLN